MKRLYGKPYLRDQALHNSRLFCATWGAFVSRILFVLGWEHFGQYLLSLPTMPGVLSRCAPQTTHCLRFEPKVAIKNSFFYAHGEHSIVAVTCSALFKFGGDYARIGH